MILGEFTVWTPKETQWSDDQILILKSKATITVQNAIYANYSSSFSNDF